MLRARLAVAAVLLSFVLACGEEVSTQANRPPDIESPGPQLVTEGQLVSFKVSATDLDDDPVTLSVESKPENASFDPASGQFAWVPGTTQAGNYPIVFVAS